MAASLTLIPEIMFTATPGNTILHLDDPSRGLLDTGTLGGSNDGVDVLDYVRTISIQRGVSRHDGVYARAEAGTCSMLLDNRDRRFDPTNTAGPYVAAGVTQVQPMREFRVRAQWGSTTYDLWRGFADGWALTYPNYGWSDAITSLTGTDATKVIANYDGAEQSDAGAGERTDQRIARILDNVGWEATYRDLDTGLTTCQATNLSSNAWTEILLTADTEIGEVLFDEAGKLSFRNRHAILTDTRSATSQATFGDGGSELAYTDVVIDHDDTQVFNEAHVARTGGSSQTATDTASQTMYLKRTFNRTDLVHETDTESLNYAQYVIALHADGELRFSSITINPDSDPANLYPQVLGRKIGDRITVKLTPPDASGSGSPATISRDVFIRGITHEIELDSWRTTWALQDASKFAMFILDSATNGVLDTNTLGF